MAITTESKGNRIEDNITIQNAFSALRKDMTDYEVERNAEVKTKRESYRKKYNDDLDKTEESLNKLTTS